MTDTIDMSRHIEAKSDQLNADDLIGTSRVLTITRVVGCDGDQPVAIYYEGDNGKPFKPCKTIRRVLMAAWGKYANEYVGKSMRVYRDDSVTFGGLSVGGIRISHMSGIDKKMVVVVMKSKGKKAGMEILPLVDEQPSQPARQTADEWAEAHIAIVESATTKEELDKAIASGLNAMAKLKAVNPGLHDKISAAYLSRNNAMFPASDDPFGLPPIDGGTDEQYGDQHDGTDRVTDDVVAAASVGI